MMLFFGGMAVGVVITLCVIYAVMDRVFNK